MADQKNQGQAPVQAGAANQGPPKDAAPPKHTEAQIQAALRSARAAGAGKLDELEAVLRSGGDLAKVAEQIAATRERNLADYHVRGPGSVSLNGALHPPGALLRLTDVEAGDLGDAVAPGKPKRRFERKQRPAGRYKLLGPGNVWFDGRLHVPGSVLQLSQADARDIPTDLELLEG
jgi:hypothetical protein